jgi:hypothetical protein
MVRNYSSRIRRKAKAKAEAKIIFSALALENLRLT